MTIRAKTSLVIAAVHLVFLVVAVILSRSILLRSFERLEEQEIQNDVQRALNALANEQARLDSITGDWAPWDDTVAFVQGKYPGYVSNNLLDYVLVNLRTHFMIFTDDTGKPVFTKMVDPASGLGVDLPPGFQDRISLGGRLFRHAGETSRFSGIVILPDGPVLVSSQPILNSQRQGPVRGALLLGRLLDGELVRDLSEETRLSLSITGLDDPNAAGGCRDCLERLSDEKPVLVRPSGAERVAGYTLLKDLSGNPSLLLRVDERRELYFRGLQTARYFFILFVIAGVAIIGSIHILSNRTVLRRLASLSSFMNQLSLNGILSRRLSVSGNEELTILAATANRLLDAIEKVNAELRRAKQEAESASKVKSDFLASISHEVRTPLNHIIGFTELLLEESIGLLNPEQKEYLRDVLYSSRHLLSLINDILDLAKVEAGKLELKPAPVDPSKLVEAGLRMLKDRADSRGIEMSSELSGLPESIRADERALRQILYNLLSNAVKFTPDGGQIRVLARTEEGGRRLAISVLDTGIGLKEEDLERIFDPFTQVDNPVNRRNAGTGLGLPLARKLVELHGGRLWAQSGGEGKGSRFHFTIPL